MIIALVGVFGAQLYRGFVPAVPVGPEAASVDRCQALSGDRLERLCQHGAAYLCHGLRFLATISRLMRTSMLDVLGADYIKTARAKGISNKERIIWRHAVRNAIMPVVTVLGPITAGILTGGFCGGEHLRHSPEWAVLCPKRTADRLFPHFRYHDLVRRPADRLQSGGRLGVQLSIRRVKLGKGGVVAWRKSTKNRFQWVGPNAEESEGMARPSVT